jgi:hypothetical protein
MHHRSVGLRLTGKLKAADNTLKTFTLGGADDVNELTILKVGDGPLTEFRGGFSILEAEFTDKTLWSGGTLCKVTKLGLADAMLLLVSETDLDGGISILLLVLNLKYAIAACLDDSNGADATFRVIDTGHADFFSENADAHNA